MRNEEQTFKPSFPVTKLAKVGGLEMLFELRSLIRFFQATVKFGFQVMM